MMLNRSIILALSCILLSACRFDAAEESGRENLTGAANLPSNNEVLARAYDVSYQSPEDFYVDGRADTSGTYSLYHVKDPSVSYELCTDEYVEAMAWEEADNASRAVNGAYVTSIETSMYFEFVRELSYPSGVGNVPDPTSPGFARVFKCSYINRDGADRNLRNGYAGDFGITPLSGEVIKTYSEYMWQFTFFWPARKKVLDSYSASTANGFQNTLLLVLVTNRGDEQCDLVELVNWVFSVDESSGQVSKTFLPVRQLEAQLIDGLPYECAD